MSRLGKAPVWAALLLAPALAWGRPPRILYSDLESGPSSGGENGGGAYVTIYGRSFGASRGTAYVTIGGGRAVAYPVWTDTEVSFQLGAGSKTGTIVLTTDQGASNPVPFTVRGGKIRFVAPNGSDSGPGAAAAPWRTLPYARNHMGAGDIVYVRNGVTQTDDSSGWDCALLIKDGGSGDSGSAGAPKAMVVYPGESATIGSIGGLGSGIRTAGASYWVFAGFSLRGKVLGISTFLGSGWRFVGNDVTCPNGDGAAACIETQLTTNAKFLGNKVHDAGTATASSQYHGVYFSTDSNHVEFGWNTIANVRGGRGLQVHSTNQDASSGYNQYDILIHDNVIHDTQCDGIVLATVDPSKGPVQVYNNIIYNAGKGPNNPERTGNWSCINVAGYTNNGAAGGGTVEVYNNTMYRCGTFANPPYGDSRNAVQNGGHNPTLRMRLRNNILYQPPGVPYLTMWNSSGALCAASDNCPSIYGTNNLFYGSGPAPSSTTFTHSLSADPLFANAAQFDFHLTAQSPARRQGIETGLTWDEDGVARGGTAGTDLGALQFAGAGISALACSPAAVVPPADISCVVTLASDAPDGGATLAVGSNTGSLPAPAPIAVPAGASSASFTVHAAATAARTEGALTASYGQDSASATVFLLAPGDSSPVITAVVNSASYLPVPLSPGALVTAFGVNLGPGTGVAEAASTGASDGTSLGSTRALFDGVAAHLVYAQARQVSAIVPYGIEGKDSVTLEIEVGGRRSNAVALPALETGPGIFSADLSGQGQAVALNGDGTLNSSSNPAHPGSPVVFFATGLGQTIPPSVDGQPAPAGAALAAGPLSLRIGGVGGEEAVASIAADGATGVFQINAVIPDDAVSGDTVPLILTAGDAASQPNITLAVR